MDANPILDCGGIWREAALEALDLQCADKAFVRCSDYQGIQFVKRLRALSDRMKRKAEVAAFFGRFEEAEQIYRDIDRKDLAIDLRTRLGDWQRVAELVRSGAGDDKTLQASYLKLGDHYAGRSRWSRAREFYDLAGDVEKRASCYYRLEDFDALEKLLSNLPERHPLLGELGRMFESVGLHTPAVDAYLRANEPKQAVDCCVLLNQWERAAEIAEDHGYQQIEGLLAKRSGQLLREGQKLLAVELYRRANRPTDAAKLLATIAEEVGVKNACPVRAKKLHVLAALEVERFRKKALDLTTTNGDIAQTTAATLDTLMTQDADSGTGAGRKIMDNAWRGAACYHYYCLAHRQLYDAQYVDAMKTSIRLSEYEDILPKVDIYSLVALSAYHAKDWYVCSKAFIKLETLDDPPQCDDEKEDYLEEIQKLAIDIFTDHAPGDKSPNNLDPCYFECLNMGVGYAACTKTGRPCSMGARSSARRAGTTPIESALDGANCCPLCHSAYPDERRPESRLNPCTQACRARGDVDPAWSRSVRPWGGDFVGNRLPIDLRRGRVAVRRRSLERSSRRGRRVQAAYRLQPTPATPSPLYIAAPRRAGCRASRPRDRSPRACAGRRAGRERRITKFRFRFQVYSLPNARLHASQRRALVLDGALAWSPTGSWAWFSGTPRKTLRLVEGSPLYIRGMDRHPSLECLCITYGQFIPAKSRSDALRLRWTARQGREKHGSRPRQTIKSRAARNGRRTTCNRRASRVSACFRGGSFASTSTWRC